MVLSKILLAGCSLIVCSAPVHAQDQAPVAPGAAASNGRDSAQDKEPERWNLSYQATSIGDHHGTFTAPYTGPLSLQNYPERDVSITTTLFFTGRLERNTFLVFDPEIAGGKGFSNV